MPFVHIQIAGPALTSEQVRALQEGATSLMAGVMHKKAELTAVRVEQMPAETWAIGGKSVAIAAHLDVKVTAGTNTAEEKARFIEASMGLLRSVLGPQTLNPATYVVIHELPADAWGYDGRTQDDRRRTGAPR